MKKKINLIVKENGNNSRVDLYINNSHKEISRTRIKNLILDDKLKINYQIIINPSKKFLKAI